MHALTRGQLIGTIAELLLALLDQTLIANLNGFERYAWVTTAYLSLAWRS